MGELRSVSDAEIVQEEECCEVGEWGEIVSVMQRVQEEVS